MPLENQLQKKARSQLKLHNKTKVSHLLRHPTTYYQKQPKSEGENINPYEQSKGAKAKIMRMDQKSPNLIFKIPGKERH